MKKWLPILVVVFLLLAGGFGLMIAVVVLGPHLGIVPHKPVGAILVYEVDPESVRDPLQHLSPREMDRLIEAVDRRLNPGWQRRGEVRQVEGEKASRLEVALYGDDPEEIRRIASLIERIGTLEFRILANNRDHQAIIEMARSREGRDVRDADGNLLGWWVPFLEGDRPEDKQRVEDLVLGFLEIAHRTRKDQGKEIREILVVNDEYNVTGAYLSSASPGTDHRGEPCVNFAFDRVGAQLFGGLTGDNLPDRAQNFNRKLGIIIDGKLYSAPSIQSTVYDRGVITGSFTREEVEDLCNVLNAGSLPAKLRLVEERGPGR